MTRSSAFKLSSLAAALMVGLSVGTPALAQAAGTDAMPKDKAAVEAAFKRADVNKDGKLSKAEAAMLPNISARFDEIDKDKKGYLTMEEFMGAATAPAN